MRKGPVDLSKAQTSSHWCGVVVRRGGCQLRSKNYSLFNCFVSAEFLTDFHKSNLTVHSCPHCPYETLRRFDLNRHSVVHTGSVKVSEYFAELNQSKEIFSCAVCNYSTFRKDSLKRHSLVHTNSRPFACSICDKRFNHSSSLKSHYMSHLKKK
ncbi:hypothetical protein TNCV_889251 [Trichonephila clavipes]|nr:hypothetical protein TNCV_889251 [Trichonephila clavipes]